MAGLDSQQTRGGRMNVYRSGTADFLAYRDSIAPSIENPLHARSFRRIAVARLQAATGPQKLRPPVSQPLQPARPAIERFDEVRRVRRDDQVRHTRAVAEVPIRRRLGFSEHIEFRIRAQD